MMYTTSPLEQMVVSALLERVAAEWGAAPLPCIMKIGNYQPSGYQGTVIVYGGGLSPTVRENHGMVTATIVKV